MGCLERWPQDTAVSTDVDISGWRDVDVNLIHLQLDKVLSVFISQRTHSEMHIHLHKTLKVNSIKLSFV